MSEIEILKALIGDMVSIITGKLSDTEKIQALYSLLDKRWVKEGEL